MLPLVKLTMLNRFWLIVLRAYLVAASRLVNMRKLARSRAQLSLSSYALCLRGRRPQIHRSRPIGPRARRDRSLDKFNDYPLVRVVGI